MKSAPPEIYDTIADVLNKAISYGEDLELGLTKLVVVQKPGKPAGPLKNLRPIALLPLLRKVLSLITLARVRSVFDSYVSHTQSGFRRGRSCCDIVWAHRWLIAEALKCKIIVYLLGLDMSRAFDTIDRTKLITVIEFMPDIRSDDCKLIRVLLSNTTLRVSFNGVMTDPFVCLLLALLKAMVSPQYFLLSI